MSNKLLFPTSDWSIPEIYNAWEKISILGKRELKLDFYDPEINVITYEQTLALYSFNFLPTMYAHWSFGKQYSVRKELYGRGKMGLPYEIIINTDPSIVYLEENNTSTVQMLTLAHAACGHSAFFKNNFLFKSHTDPKFILPYIAYANEYIRKCENKYDPERVEILLDLCHSLQNHGVFKYKRHHLNKKDQEAKSTRRYQVKEENINEFNLSTTRTREPLSEYEIERAEMAEKYSLPQENFLYFIEKHSLVLKDWEKEIVRIVRKIAQYFYPQILTKLMNEGYASFIHYELMGLMYQKKMMTEGQYIEFLDNHSSVLYQQDYVDDINPYKLGFEIFSNIKKICLTPTKDDYYWFPDIAGTKDWVKATDFAMRNFIDESFILQYLSLDTVEKLQLFSIEDNTSKPYLLITDIQNERDFRELRKKISKQYAGDSHIPNIEIVDYNAYKQKLSIETNLSGKELDEDMEQRVQYNLTCLTGCDIINR